MTENLRVRRGAVAALVACAAALSAAQGAAVSVDVVSIRKVASNSGNSGPSFPPRLASPQRIEMRRWEFRSIILDAYQANSASDLVNGPAWLDQERFDLQATLSGEAKGQIPRDLIKQILAERLKLRVHFEPREQQVLALVLAQPTAGRPPALVPTTHDCEAWESRLKEETSPTPVFAANGGMICMVSGTVMGRILAGGARLTQFAWLLTRSEGVDIVDQTGLPGRYEFTFEYAPSVMRRGAVEPNSDERPSLSTALREQLGLKLEPRRVTRDVLVIDHVERPEEN
jgi:uncharacterized protein (TIGR03435 family)